MKKSTIVLIVLWSITFTFLLAMLFLVYDCSYDKFESAKADEPTPSIESANYYKRLLPSDLSIGVNSNAYNLFNNGFSFVFWGSSSQNTNIEVSIEVPTSLGLDYRNNSAVLSFDSSNANNTISLLNFKIQYDYDVNNWQTDFVFSPTQPCYDFDIVSGNSYFLPYSAVELRFVFTFVVSANVYNEFAFNDFTLDFFSDYAMAFNDGFENGYDSARRDFYQPRYDLGYSDGFNEGASGQYSFFALISAVVETPINAVLGMLDFNFLDINLKSFFLSVFTIALIVMILRFVLAKN